MRPSYLIDTPAAAATRAASPVTLPGVSGAPRLAARARLARGTGPVGPSPASADAYAAMLVQLRCAATEREMEHAYSIVDVADHPMRRQ